MRSHEEMKEKEREVFSCVQLGCVGSRLCYRLVNSEIQTILEMIKAGSEESNLTPQLFINYFFSTLF